MNNKRFQWQSSELFKIIFFPLFVPPWLLILPDFHSVQLLSEKCSSWLICVIQSDTLCLILCHNLFLFFLHLSIFFVSPFLLHSISAVLGWKEVAPRTSQQSSQVRHRVATTTLTTKRNILTKKKKKNHLKGAQRVFYFLQIRESSPVSNTFRDEALISFTENHLLSVPRKQKSCSVPFSVLSNHENEENKTQPYGCKQQQLDWSFIETHRQTCCQTFWFGIGPI